MRLVDLHSHILPALDDGALDLRDSVAMARQAEADGIEDVCATPHIRRDHDVRITELADLTWVLNDLLEKEGVETRVLTGGEVAEPIVDDLDDDELRLCSLGGGHRWILLEPNAGPLTDGTTETVRDLHARGFGVVLAHPERHASDDLHDRLRALVAEGVLVQMTAQFILDGHGIDLAEAGLVHVLGSDAHSSHGGRRLELSAALERLAEIPALAPHAEWISRTAPRAIVCGEPLAPPY